MPRDENTQWEKPGEEFGPLDIRKEYERLPIEERQMTVRDLWSRYTTGEIVLEPDFQRHYVWDKIRASRFIESLLLGAPVPPIFLAENPDGTLDVIDGHQRLETLFKFMQPLLAGPSGGRLSRAFSPLTLTGCEVRSDLNGRGVTALNIDERARLWERKQNVILIKKDADASVKFDLFARLNLGAMALNNQELRNCLYRGPYNQLIARLAESPDVLKVFGRREPDKRMTERERVLRFFALAHRRAEYRTPFREFLSDEMRVNRHASPDQLSAFRVEFESALNWTKRFFPTNEFQMFRVGNVDNANGHWVRRRADLLYELELVGFHELRERLETVWSSLAQLAKRESFVFGLRHRLIDVMVVEGFLQTFSEQTTAPHIMRRRFDYWLGALRSSVENHEQTLQEAGKIASLMRMSTACSLCPSLITSAEDACLVQVGSEERLAHRFCRRGQIAKPL